MATKVILIGVLLMVVTSLLVTRPVQAKKSKSSKSSSESSLSDAFPCLDNELESCRLKRKTLSRLRASLEDLQNIDNQGECQDRCESTVGKRGKRLEQCMCLCNYYNVCIGSIGDNGSGTAEGSGTESKSKSKTGKSKKSRSKTEGSGGLGEEEEETSKSKKSPSKAKSRKSKKF